MIPIRANTRIILLLMMLSQWLTKTEQKVGAFPGLVWFGFATLSASSLPVLMYIVPSCGTSRRRSERSKRPTRRDPHPTTALLCRRQKEITVSTVHGEAPYSRDREANCGGMWACFGTLGRANSGACSLCPHFSEFEQMADGGKLRQSYPAA